MESNFLTALEILGVGMLTIFSILSLVVLLGQGLIRLVNRFSPDLPASDPSSHSSQIPPHHLVAIQAAVETVTAGQGSVSSVTR